MSEEEAIKRRFERVSGELNERARRLVEPVTRGDPESLLRWTCKSVRKLAEELVHQGHQVSHQLGSRVAARTGLQLAGQS
jgi:hypothetical protein